MSDTAIAALPVEQALQKRNELGLDRYSQNPARSRFIVSDHGQGTGCAAGANRHHGAIVNQGWSYNRTVTHQHPVRTDRRAAVRHNDAAIRNIRPSTPFASVEFATAPKSTGVAGLMSFPEMST